MKTKNENKTSSKTDKKVDDTKFCQKFNDAKSLENSYNELQRDYTRKCQELASYKKLEQRIIEEKKVESLKDILNMALSSLSGKANQNDGFTFVPENVKFESVSQDLNKIDNCNEFALSSENDMKNIEKQAENAEKCMKNGEDCGEKVEDGRDYLVACIKNVEAGDKNVENGIESIEKDASNILKNGENIENSIENVENIAKNSEKIAKIGKIYEMPDWSLKVLDFFEVHPDAKEISEDIAGVLISDDGVAGLANGLDVAYSIAKSKKLKSPESLLSDEEFVSSKILSSDDIKNKILESFLGGVLERKKSMPAFSSSTKSGTIISSPKKPKTLDDARSFLLGSLLK